MICREAKFNLERRRRAPCFAVSTSDGSATLVLEAGHSAVSTFLDRAETTAVLLSHFHPGHYHALQGYRSSQDPISIFCPPDRDGQAAFGYEGNRYNFRELPVFVPHEIGDFTITPVLLNHSVITFGYCIETGGKRFSYLCDTCGLPPQTEAFLADWEPDALIVDCNQHPRSPKPNHNTPKQALKIHRLVKPAHTYLAHISCRVAGWLHPKPSQFPTNVHVAQDGMVIDLSNPTTLKKARWVLA
jgi:phosphoribosyl 1,2-cyclic phosphate phosphodiesterase